MSYFINNQKYLGADIILVYSGSDDTYYLVKYLGVYYYIWEYFNTSWDGKNINCRIYEIEGSKYIKFIKKYIEGINLSDNTIDELRKNAEAEGVMEILGIGDPEVEGQVTLKVTGLKPKQTNDDKLVDFFNNMINK